MCPFDAKSLAPEGAFDWFPIPKWSTCRTNKQDHTIGYSSASAGLPLPLADQGPPLGARFSYLSEAHFALASSCEALSLQIEASAKGVPMRNWRLVEIGLSPLSSLAGHLVKEVYYYVPIYYEIYKGSEMEARGSMHQLTVPLYRQPAQQASQIPPNIRRIN
ncbi:hypothetical protein CPB84DRAFT_1744202 [Gymnopilus junonius]|uniref:Uncharacterized protein n=1 Tax=Gymnopilus junonius TaxID=109634 RepID=A0A9P5TRF1_GYMJU|nr:hypothetical protein CPB84DRAFT_1744202 [Gymnopilus junonius]